MSAVPFDSHAAVKRLTASGFDERQAEALVETLSARQGDLVTKADIHDMATKGDLAELRAATKADIVELRAATRADFAELRHEIGALENRFIKWMVALIVPLYAALIAVLLTLFNAA